MSSQHLSKTDSDVSALTQSSPARSPPPPVYYVQSPSSDSHDGQKTRNSFQSTPVISPTGSPPHSHSNSSFGPHSSRESYSTRHSYSLKHHRGKHDRRNRNPWKDQFDAIDEDFLIDGDDGSSNQNTRRKNIILFIIGFILFFSVFCLILWGVSQEHKPIITVKSIIFDEFRIQSGIDSSSMTTDMASINCTLKLKFRNTASFFGVHVTSTPLHLSYYQLTLANGAVGKFYQKRKSERVVKIRVKGNQVALYGAAASLTSFNGLPANPVPLKLSFMFRSRGYVLGRLVKVKFYKKVECFVIMDPKKMNVAISLKKNCFYR